MIVNNQGIRCEACNSMRTRVRIKTNEKVCEHCGDVTKLGLDKVTPKKEDPLTPIEEEQTLDKSAEAFFYGS